MNIESFLKNDISKSELNTLSKYIQEEGICHLKNPDNKEKYYEALKEIEVYFYILKKQEQVKE